MRKESLSNIFKLKQAGVLLVAVLLIASYSVSSTIRFGEDGSGQLWMGSDTGLITNSNGKAWTATCANLQSAIWDLNSTGGIVYLPTVTFTPTSTIYVPNGVRILGSDMTHFDCTSFDDVLFNVGSKSIIANAPMKNTLEYIHIEGSTSNTNGVGIHSERNPIHIRNCYIEKMYTGIELEGECYWTTIEDSIINYGIYSINAYYGDGDYGCNGLTIEKCNIGANEYGINLSVSTLSGVSIRDCYIEDNGYYGINVSGEISISGCRIVTNDTQTGSVGVVFNNSLGYRPGMIINCHMKSNTEDYVIKNIGYDNLIISDNEINVIQDGVGIYSTVGCVLNCKGNDFVMDSVNTSAIKGNYTTSVITGNQISHGNASIYIYTPEDNYYATLNIISNNYFKDSIVAIDYKGQHCVFEGNVFYDCDDVFNMRGKHNIITNNRILGTNDEVFATFNNPDKQFLQGNYGYMNIFPTTNLTSSGIQSGYAWFETSTNTLHIYDGADDEWVHLT